MNIDPGPKIRIDRNDVAKRINNVGILVGTRVRQVSWLDTYHRRAVITTRQYHAGDEFSLLCRNVLHGYAPIRYDRIPGGRFDPDMYLVRSEEYKAAVAVIPKQCLNITLDLCLYDYAIGTRRLPLLRESLDDLAKHFKIAN